MLKHRVIDVKTDENANLVFITETKVPYDTISRELYNDLLNMKLGEDPNFNFFLSIKDDKVSFMVEKEVKPPIPAEHINISLTINK